MAEARGHVAGQTPPLLRSAWGATALTPSMGNPSGAVVGARDSGLVGRCRLTPD